jgi:hypothetical protein
MLAPFVTRCTGARDERTLQPFLALLEAPPAAVATLDAWIPR